MKRQTPLAQFVAINCNLIPFSRFWMTLNRHHA